jgi:hypothetical protein
MNFEDMTTATNALLPQEDPGALTAEDQKAVLRALFGIEGE